MNFDISYYCQKYKCGRCCERNWDIFVTEADIKNWEKKKPEILYQITTKIIDGIEKKILKKRPVKFLNGKIRELCVFYDFEKKCTIHEFNPEICKKFSCLHHPYFIFQLFSKISELAKDF
ncbi:MAG: YkgJ family cysteine cluster protein [Candidatus Helarchaeota archaeon]|nr:YkgJ family cysteine cluster protein [Candidatus Helarchaeota archaeon]